MQDLENKLKGKESKPNANDVERYPMMLYNSKCFFCNQEVKRIKYILFNYINIVSPEVIQLCDPKSQTQSLLYRELNLRGQKVGPGFSRMLTALKEEPDMEQFFNPPQNLGNIAFNTKLAGNMRFDKKKKSLGVSNSTMSLKSAIKLAPIYSPKNKYSYET